MGNFDLDGQVIGGATFKVTSGGYGNDCGVAELHGPVGQLLIGGQELVVDNITNTEDEPCQYGYEDLLTGDTYNYPDTFVTDGILCRQLGFQWGSSTWFFNGTTTVDNRAYACASGNELWLNNSMIAHDFAASVGTMENVSLQFGEYGCNVNIDINGDFRNVANFIDLDGMTIGGVTVHVPTGGLGNDCGKTGRVDVLAIGGQECWIDCLEGDVATTPQGDANNDGSVNVQDLLELLSQWGQCSGDCSADFNGDQMVDVTDILTMLANWGQAQGNGPVGTGQNRIGHHDAAADISLPWCRFPSRCRWPIDRSLQRSRLISAMRYFPSANVSCTESSPDVPHPPAWHLAIPTVDQRVAD